MVISWNWCEPYTRFHPSGFACVSAGSTDRPGSPFGAGTPAQSRTVGATSVQLAIADVVAACFVAGRRTISGRWTPAAYRVVFAPWNGGPLSRREKTKAVLRPPGPSRLRRTNRTPRAEP